MRGMVLPLKLSPCLLLHAMFLSDTLFLPAMHVISCFPTRLEIGLFSLSSNRLCYLLFKGWKGIGGGELA